MVKGLLKSKRLSRLATVGLSTGVLTTSLFLGAVSPSYAAHRTTGRCSLATTNGRYVFAADGFQTVGRKQVPVAFAGQETYDGNGHVRGVVTLIQGTQVSRQVPFTARYTITPQCVMSISIKLATGMRIHADQYIAPSGRLFSFVLTDSGTVVEGWETRVLPGKSDARTSEGTLPFLDGQEKMP